MSGRGMLGFVAALCITAAPAAAQELALKGGIAVSRFDIDGNVLLDRSFTSTSFGIHYRIPAGPVAVQPELYMISRGAKGDVDGAEERMKLDYLEIPLLLVAPFRVATFEPYVFAGPWVGLETRCRYSFEDEGLTTNLGCESAVGGAFFDRRALDYGYTAGAGAAHQLGGGRIMLEARHSQGLRNIYDGELEADVRNRSFVVMLGYTLDLSLGER